ncbi:MAG: HD domain-containing protein [Chloroflexota bacterium]
MTNRTDPAFWGLPAPEGAWAYTPELLRALQAAAVMHGAQLRKESGIPYLSHLLGTCSIVLDHGGSEEEAIAALLHDSLEDVRPAALVRPVVEGFGSLVLHIVEACTDGEPDEDGVKEDWRVRKERYIDHVRTACGPALLVSAADKLHNARSIVADVRRDGRGIFGKFKKGRDDTLWYYEHLVEAFRENPASNDALVDELARTVGEMRVLP